MKSTNHTTVVERLVGPLGKCLTPESARKLIKLRADPALQAQVNSLAKRHHRGLLTPKEQAEYGRFVSFGTFVAILKSKARQLLANSAGE